MKTEDFSDGLSYTILLERKEMWRAVGKLHLKEAQQDSEQNCQQQKWLPGGNGSVMKPRWPSC